MKINSLGRKTAFGAAAVIAAIGIAATTSAPAQNTMMVSKERIALMKEMGKNLGMIGKAVKGEMAVDLAQLGPAAAVISTNATKLKDMFHAGSGGGDTRALPIIWDKKAEYDAFFVDLASASDAFAKEAATGTMANLKASFGAIAKNCGGCHKVYRAPKK